MYRYLYIYHLEGHAEKMGDRSGIYRKKKVCLAFRVTLRGSTQQNERGKTGTLVLSVLWGTDRGAGLGARSPRAPAGSPVAP